MINTSRNILKTTTFEDCLQNNESYKKIEGYDNYYITTLGRIWNIKENCWDGDCAKIVKKIDYDPKQCSCEYVELENESGKTKFSVARLVADTFIENYNNYKYVRRIAKNEIGEYFNSVSNIEREEFDFIEIYKKEREIEKAKAKIKEEEIRNEERRLKILNSPYPLPDDFKDAKNILLCGISTKYYINKDGIIFDSEENIRIRTEEIRNFSGGKYYAFRLMDPDGREKIYTKTKLLGYVYGLITEDELNDPGITWIPKDGNRSNTSMDNISFVCKGKNLTKEERIEYYENIVKKLKGQD